MKIAIATDAWAPQVNGVVRTYENTCKALQDKGHELLLLTPQDYKTIPCPSYPSIRLALRPGPRLTRNLDAFEPEAIHIATEGPIGHAARRYCRQRQLPFTTSFHTQFPEYMRMRAPIPLGWTYAYMRRFHAAAERTLVPTPSQRQRLLDRGFRNVEVWSRGVDTDLFKPGDKDFLDYPRPIFLYMGRVAIEKNIEAFLRQDLPGSKVVVGDGPDLARLKQQYPEVKFSGYKFGEELAQHIAAADVFVFPSLTDTYGLVMLEAMACGVPVAAFPITGPIDVVRQGETGILDQDLRTAALAALELEPKACIDYARAHSWQRCTETFVSYLAPIPAKARLSA